MANSKVVEESFGHQIPQPSMKKGRITTFGDRVTDSNFTDRSTFSVNQKTGVIQKGEK